MKKVIILVILTVLITACVPEPEELAGVTREELISGKAVDKVLQINKPDIKTDDEAKQTLEQAHEKEIVDVAENAWDDLRDNEGAPRILEDGAIEAGVGQKFKVSTQ